MLILKRTLKKSSTGMSRKGFLLKMKEINEIIEMGRRLDELSYETYSLFVQQENFDKNLISLWAKMAEWKKSQLKHWKRISKSFVYRNMFNRTTDDLEIIIRQLKNIHSELIEFLRRLRKKKISQDEAISQTILNEFCLISDVFLEIFYTYDEQFYTPKAYKYPSISCVEECETHLVKMANTLKPYLKLNPLYAVLLKSIVELKHKYDFLLTTYGKMTKATVS